MIDDSETSENSLPRDSAPGGTFLKSFTSLRRQVKRKPSTTLNSNSKIRNVKVTNSNAPDSPRKPVKPSTSTNAIEKDSNEANETKIESSSKLESNSNGQSIFNNSHPLLPQPTELVETEEDSSQQSQIPSTSDKSPKVYQFAASNQKPIKPSKPSKTDTQISEQLTSNHISAASTSDEISSNVDESIQVSKEDIQLVKSIISQQLTGSFNNLLQSSLLDKYKEIYSVFEHTIKDNEGHSLLLIGPRSSGKTSMINKALSELHAKYQEKFITIRLNAFIHADDNVALREIAKQLDYNVNKHDDVQRISFEQRSINDTFSNILSTLDKHGDESDDNEKISIIFIIDEFDKFTSNNKQTLLYNLFDLCQTSSIPICIVGVSTKITTRESLEKRVRSRFSQRIISINKPLNLDSFWNDAKLSITLNNDSIDKLDNKKYGEVWNNYIENLYRQKTSNLFKIVFQDYHTLKNFKQFNNNCIYAISRLSISAPFVQDNDLITYEKNQSKNHIQSIIASLSNLELLLTIAGARWIEKYDLQVINFNLAYGEYKAMIKQYNIESTTSSSTNAFDSNILTNIKVNHKIWSTKVLKNLWEILYKLGLLLDATGITTNNEGHVITNVNLNKNLIIEDNKMVQLDVSLDELANLIPESNIFKRLTRL